MSNTTNTTTTTTSTVKVFCGNLSFKTQDDDLAQAFRAVGKVVSANIITRGPRSLGYGFVEMETQKDAENAVAKMNHKELDGRQINVEIAKPRQENTNNNNGGGFNNRGDRGDRGGGNSRGRGGGFGGGFRGRGRGGFSGGFRSNNNNNNNNNRGFYKRSDDQQNQNNNNEGNSNRVRNNSFNNNNRRNQFRNDRDMNTNHNRVESTTTLFVANLPFSLDDDSFGKIFADNNLAYKSAHVVIKRNQRSKGFGFVEFDNQQDQQKALTTINGLNVENRDLVVKVALTDQQPNSNASDVKTKPASVTNTNASSSSSNTSSQSTATTAASTTTGSKSETSKDDTKKDSSASNTDKKDDKK